MMAHRYGEAQELASADADTINLIGERLEQADHVDEAIEAYSRAMYLDPNVAVYRVNLGVLLMMRNELAAALERFQVAERLEPKGVHLMLLTGFCLSRMGKHSRHWSSSDGVSNRIQAATPPGAVRACPSAIWRAGRGDRGL